MLSYVITKNDLFFYDDCEVAEHFLEVVISLLALQHVVQQAPGHHVVVQPGGLRPDAVNSPFHLHSAGGVAGVHTRDHDIQCAEREAFSQPRLPHHHGVIWNLAHPHERRRQRQRPRGGHEKHVVGIQILHGK